MSPTTRNRTEVQWQKKGIKHASIPLYEAILARQGHKCALCPRVQGPKRFILDYDLDTKQIRGLLCKPCSMDIRQVEALLSDRARLDQLASYIAQPERPVVAEAESEVGDLDAVSLTSVIEQRKTMANRRFRELFIDGLEKGEAIKQTAQEMGKCTRTIRRYLGLR